MSGAWSWPTEPDPREPFADPRGVADSRQAALEAAEAGLAGLVDLPPVTPLDPGGPPVDVADRLPSEQDLVRIATEHDPGVVGSAPDRVLGPWADLADPHARLVAVAWGALFPGDGWDRSPASRWLRSEPGPPPELRAGLIAVLRTPPAVWRIAALDGDRLGVEDLLGLEAPTGPIHLRPPAMPVGPPGVGEWLMARLVRTPIGWEAVTPIALPPAPAILARWLTWETAIARVADPAVRTVTDLLRARGHHLARRILEAAWAVGR